MFFREQIPLSEMVSPAFPACAEEVLIVFLRYPEPGRVKTLLIPAYGPEGEARICRRMADHVFSLARGLDRPGLTRIVCFTPASRVVETAEWIGNDFHIVPQVEADLGGRLRHAFLGAFQNGARRVTVIRTDCVEITPEILDEAFDALRGGDAAIGPSLDGGYYLLGLSRPCRHAFQGIPWSTDRTLHVTLSRLRGCGLTVRILPPLLDIDRPADLDPDRNGQLD